jgi:putative copper export protein
MFLLSQRMAPGLARSPSAVVPLFIFIITGTYLMLIDSGYLGFMNFGNFLGSVMLLKHILLLAMIGMGFWFNAIMRVGPMMSSNNPEQAIARFRKTFNAMAICGALVLLLTALAKVE